MAAESGERRAARLRAAVAQDPGGGAARLAAARRIEQGNDGERRVAQLLDVLDGAGWVVLHDRYKNAASPGNLDHIAVGPAGVFVIDTKNWTGGRLRLDDRGMAIGRYRRDDDLLKAKVDADIVRRIAGNAVPDAPTQAVVAFVEDVGLTDAVPHQQVVLLQAEQLLSWLTREPARLTTTQVHQIGSTLDAALPPRDGPRRAFVLPSGLQAAPRRRPARTTQATGTRPTGRPASPGHPARQAARAAGRELTAGLRRLAAFLVVAAAILFVAVPVASRVLPPLLTHLLQASLSHAVPAPVRTPAETPAVPLGQAAAPRSTCTPTPTSPTPTPPTPTSVTSISGCRSH